MDTHNVKVTGEEYVSHPINAIVLAFTRWRDTNLWTSIKLILLTILVATAVVALFLVAAGSSANASGLFSENVTLQQFMSWALGVGWIYLLSLVVALILVCLPFNIGIDYSFVTAQNNRKVGVKESIQRGLKRFGVALGTYVLGFLFVLVGFVALIIPGIYIALRLSYLNSVVANENLGPVDNIRRSWALTKSNLWDIIGAVSAGNIAVTLVSILVTVVSINTTALGSSLAIIFSVISVVLSIITAQVYYFRYHQSVLEKAGELKKEGTDTLNYILFAVMLLVTAIDSSTTNQLNPNPTGLPTNIDET